MDNSLIRERAKRRAAGEKPLLFGGVSWRGGPEIGDADLEYDRERED